MGTDSTGDVDWDAWETAYGLADDTGDTGEDDSDHEDDLSYEEGF